MVRARGLLYGLMLAFVLQGVATQSHFHNLSGLSGAASAAYGDVARLVAAKGDAGPKRLPNDDGRDCPICHAAAVAGTFVAATTFSIFVPPFDLFYVAHDERTIAVERHAAAWRSRAPPIL